MIFDFKISVVEAYKNGLNYKEIREKFHVTKTCFYDWLKLYNTKVHQKKKLLHTRNTKNCKKSLRKFQENLKS